MISKSPINTNGCSNHLAFTRNARTAWSNIINSFQTTKIARVLLPSYIGYTDREGSGVFDPIKQASSLYEFYSLDDSLKIDLEEFEKLIIEHDLNIALVIHYFGFCPNDMDMIHQICRKHNVILVEDCAHAFQFNSVHQRLGKYGDYSFYSIHKHIATSSGGILRINNEKIDLVSIETQDRAPQDALEQLIRTDLDRVAEARRRNYLLYERLLSPQPGFEPMYVLREKDVPQTFPIRVKNNEREKLYFHLMGKEMIVIALYYRLIDEIKIELFPKSHLISQEILNLPVHQDITTEDIESICWEVGNYFRTGKHEPI